MSETKPHILIFPFPAHGHMFPLLDLTHQFAIRGLAITILVTPKNLPLLNPILSKHPFIETLVLPFPTHPTIPAGVENVKDLPISGFQSMIYTLRQLHNPIMQWFKTHPSPPTAIVHDFFLGFCLHLCTELGVPGYVFSPSNSLWLAIVYSLWHDLPKRRDERDNNEMIPFSKVPKYPVYPWWQLSHIYRCYVGNESHPMLKFIKANFVESFLSYGLVINSFTALDTIYFEYIKEVLGHDRIWVICPFKLPESDSSGPLERGGSSAVSADEVSSWLDKCEDHAVIYACFGSQFVLSNNQIEALALALEKSGVKFILAVKCATKGQEEIEKYGQIPSGFEARVEGRGLLIKGWAPQVMILRHRATAAYLTHCGWNSVLEGIFAGVPMLAWPMGADHFLNATLLVDELKIGVKACEGHETVPNSEEVAQMLAKAVGDEFQDVRKRAIELHKVAWDAVTEGGSSFQSLEDLVVHFSAKASKNEGF